MEFLQISFFSAGVGGCYDEMCNTGEGHGLFLVSVFISEEYDLYLLSVFMPVKGMVDFEY